MKRVNTFVAMGSEVQESEEKKEEGREETAKGSRKKMLGRKRAGKEQQKESSKKQKVEEEKESEEVDELHKEGMLVHYQLIRADGSSKRYSSMIRMLQGIDREDLEALWRIVKKVKANGIQGLKNGICKEVLYGYGKLWRYPFTPITITNMLNKKLQSDHQNEMCYQLLKLMIQKMNIKFRGGLLGLKRLHGFLEVTAAQVRNRSRFGINTSSVEARISLIKLEFSSCLFADSLINLLKVSSID
ncbi:hypothetical protein Tco_1272914 [Tanacetum coccineum]